MLKTRLFAPCAIAIALFTSACSPRGGGTDPQTPAFNPQDFAQGAKVEVQRLGKWFPATVVQPFGDRFLIHYENFGNEWNETVGLDRIRAIPAAPPNYAVGEKVLVQMANRLAYAEIVAQTGPLLWRVHYDGYGLEVGEIVGPDRLKHPFTGTAPHPIGEAVGVEFNGQTLGGKILAVESADHVLVRFATFGPDYDQELAIDRLKKPPAEPVPGLPTAAAPAAAAPPAALVATKPGAPGLAVGEAVFVTQRSGWLPATIHGAAAAGWKVHYDGTASGDEDVSADRVMAAPQPLKGQHYQPNQNVYVEWHGIYVGGKVLKEQDKGQYKVRFDGQGPAADEIVPVNRLRVK